MHCRTIQSNKIVGDQNSRKMLYSACCSMHKSSHIHFRRQISTAEQHCIVGLSVRNRSNAEKCFIHSFQSPFRKVKIPASQSYRRYQKDNFLKEFIKLMHHHLPDKDSFNAEPVNHQLRPPPTLCVYPFLMDCVYKGWVIHYPPVRTAYKRLHCGLSLRYAICDRDC